MEKNYYRRYESFKKSLDALSEARSRDLTDSFVISGTGAKFSITLDLAWKIMKDIIVQYYMVTDFPAGSPKEVIKKSFQLGIIDDDIWMEMLKVRNEFAHDHDGVIVKEFCEKIVKVYLDKFYEFKNRVDEIVSEEG